MILRLSLSRNRCPRSGGKALRTTDMTKKKAEWPRKLRSQEWYGGTSRDVIYHRGWIEEPGLPARPVRRAPCHRHPQHLVGHDAVQRPSPRARGEGQGWASWEAGGFPMEVPVFSASENTFRPNGHDVSQPRGTRRRGGDPRPSRWTAACYWSAATRPRRSLIMGAAIGRSSVDRRHRRTDAERLISAASASVPARICGSSPRWSRPAR